MAHLLQQLFEEYDTDTYSIHPEHQLEPPIDIKQLEWKHFPKCKLSLPPQAWKQYIDSIPIQLIIKTNNQYNSFYKNIIKLRRKALCAQYSRKSRIKEGINKQNIKALIKEKKI
jgi:hypothetical protein